MGLDEVKNEIISGAKRESEQILKEAQKQADEIKSHALKEVEEYKAKAKKNNEKMLKTLEKKEIANAKFDAKKKLLDTKKSIISKAIEEAKDNLDKMNEPEREKYVLSLLNKAKKEIEVGTVYANKKDRKAIEKAGLKFEETDIFGGIIAETKDGRISVNYSYDEMLNEIVEKSIREIEKALF